VTTEETSLRTHRVIERESREDRQEFRKVKVEWAGHSYLRPVQTLLCDTVGDCVDLCLDLVAVNFWQLYYWDI
jgi:hypothetical protein